MTDVESAPSRLLCASDRTALLAIARNAIAGHFSGSRVPIDPEALSDALRRPAGAFVTLHIGTGLRGCIGTVLPLRPLYRTVEENALNAAFGDPRFAPLTGRELELLSIEISVLGPVLPVESLGSIVVGRDGLIVRQGRSAGLLLPQVATEYGWTADELLRQTCRKAGLPAEAAHRGLCSIERFEAEVFGEDERHQ
ncbi:MAG: AmmeMemoRadiSam system protein A [Thermoanaerobaculia bacterium]